MFVTEILSSHSNHGLWYVRMLKSWAIQSNCVGDSYNCRAGSEFRRAPRVPSLHLPQAYEWVSRRFLSAILSHIWANVGGRVHWEPFLSQFARGWFHNELISLSRATGLPYPMWELIDAANPQKQHRRIWHANSVNHGIETKPHSQLTLFYQKEIANSWIFHEKENETKEKNRGA